jgi:GNAT superfamily N-acetyltransferase
MDILEYDDVDPAGVFRLNLLGLGYALTPERVVLIRRLDPRAFPFFAIYAREEDAVAAQVGVYRLLLMTSAGPEDVGALCAVCTHPAFSRRGLAARLLDEAHARLRAAGLRFSVLGTTRSRVAHALYQQQGYAELFAPGAIVTGSELLPQDARLHAERAGAEELPLADALFARAAAGKLGFARRHPHFFAMLAATAEIGANELWLLRQDGELVGYALAGLVDGVLMVNNLLLVDGADAATAVAAIAQQLPAAQVHVRVDQASVATSLQRAGLPPAQPTWTSILIKPLVPGVTVEEAHCLLGVGSERFLASRVDVT